MGARGDRTHCGRPAACVSWRGGFLGQQSVADAGLLSRVPDSYANSRTACARIERAFTDTPGEDTQPSAASDAGEPGPPDLPPLPWGHHVVLLERIKSAVERAWYAQAAVAHGWSRAVLSAQIDTGLHRRQGQAVTNFAHTLPSPDSDLAQQTLKDPYVFDFLTLTTDAHEHEVEIQLAAHVERFLLELGTGFAFVGRQVPIEVAGHTYYLDLLFYQLQLRRYVVAELKAVPFAPEFAGKVNFYLSAVDDRLRHPDDKPTIGLLLCKGKDRMIAEYALRGFGSPIGVADWETQLVAALPEELQGSLPTVAQLEAELSAIGSAEPSTPAKGALTKRRSRQIAS